MDYNTPAQTQLISLQVHKYVFLHIFYMYEHTQTHYNSSFNYKHHLYICSLLKNVMFVPGFNRKISPAHFS